MAYHLKNIGADWAYMHPATTNKAVIYSYEKLGCKYGKCVHILSYIK
jgi:dTDP-4-amino-4,6-dideoxy-D-galactose acyltransferase